MKKLRVILFVSVLGLFGACASDQQQQEAIDAEDQEQEQGQQEQQEQGQQEDQEQGQEEYENNNQGAFNNELNNEQVVDDNNDQELLENENSNPSLDNIADENDAGLQQQQDFAEQQFDNEQSLQQNLGEEEVGNLDGTINDVEQAVEQQVVEENSNPVQTVSDSGNESYQTADPVSNTSTAGTVYSDRRVYYSMGNAAILDGPGGNVQRTLGQGEFVVGKDMGQYIQISDNAFVSKSSVSSRAVRKPVNPSQWIGNY